MVCFNVARNSITTSESESAITAVEKLHFCSVMALGSGSGGGDIAKSTYLCNFLTRY